MARLEPVKPKATRSRNGCIHCRKRKKKCDEKKPICTSCLKRHLICVYKSEETEEEAVRDDRKVSKIDSLQDVVGEEVMNILQMSSNPQLPSRIEVRLPADLTGDELSYFEYYCKKILPDLSILPQQFNYYSRIYVPLAFKDKAVLYTLVGWGCRVKKDKLSYQVENQLADGYFERVEALIQASRSKDMDRDQFVANVVCYMLLTTMEISYGDIAEWSKYFTECFRTINQMPGTFKYLLNQCSIEGSLLAENFTYYDILASQSNEHGTFYPIDNYRQLFSYVTEFHDPLQGCIRPVILLIGEIVSLLVEYTSLGLTESDNHENLTQLMQKSEDLDAQIRAAKPDTSCLKCLVSDEIEYHLTLFEAYQISAQIYLREVIRKLPPVVPERQILGYDLREDIQVMIKQPSLRKSLGFPMLLLGTSAVEQDDRNEIAQMFESLIQACGYLSSYQKLWIVVQKIWELNCNGYLYIDWYRVTAELGWRLNLGR